MPTLRVRFLGSLLSLVGAACSGGEPAAVQTPPRPAPAVASAAAPIGQEFASREPELAFRDPDRVKKLRTAFPKIDEIANDELVKQGLPSIALGVVIDGELAYANGYGFADLDAKTKPTADTVYRIGSITKSFTANALLSLRDEGVLSFDDPLAKWIPGAAGLVYPTHDSPPITLRQLLTHTSGLPRVSALPPDSASRAPTEEELVKSLDHFVLANAPGTTHLYSNLGFDLLGVAASHAAHAPYRDVVNKRVLAPLGMNATVWDRASVPKERLATAYRARGADGKQKPIDHWLLGAQEPSGGLYSSVRDLGRYVAFELAAYPARSAVESGPIKRSSVRESHFNALSTGPLHARLAEAPEKGESVLAVTSTRYGYAWVAQQTCELDDLVWHNGGIDGYRTEIAFLPEKGVGVIVLTNSGNGLPEPIAERAMLALFRTGGLSDRTRPLAPELDLAMKRLVAVQNQWDLAAYKAMLTEGRDFPPEDEQRELAGYKALHGACKGYAPLKIESDLLAIFAVDCERGHLEMDLRISPKDHRIDGFAGTSRDLPVPPEMKRLGEGVVGLVDKWDDGFFKKHLAKTTRSREQAVKYFAALREAHGACKLASMTNNVFDKSLVITCERGGDLTLALAVDPKDPDAATGYTFASLQHGTCPVR